MFVPKTPREIALMPESSTRRLAAILAADIVGYSALMGADEQRTVRDLRGHQAVILPMLGAFGGRLIDTAGDGLLAEFASVVKCVECALAIQAAMSERNANVEPGRRMHFRMGVNLGDVIVDSERIYGEGINIAARLESLAPPGGICLSEKVHEEVGNKIDAEFHDTGLQSLKNIARPVRVYSSFSSCSAPGSPAATDEETVKLPDTPSIAVLPFDDLSSDGGQQVLGDGLAEDIISTLAAVPGMRVIARQSTFRYRGARADTRRIAEELNSRYILAGSVRSAGTRVRITAQLIDARDETQIWAERYDREIADIFDVQDEITKEIVAALRVRFSGDGDALVQARGTKSVEAWKLIVRARATYDKLTARHHLEARALAEQALRFDPEYAYAWSVLGMSYMREGRLGQADYRAALAKAREYTDKAQALDGSLGVALGLSAVLHAATGSPDKAIQESRRAIERSPGDAELRSYASYALAFAGQYDEALDCAEAALDLNPFAPSWYRIVQVRCYALLKRYEEAAVLADELLAHEPELVAPSLFLAYSAYCLWQNGRARDAVRRLRRHTPHLKAEKIPVFLTIQNTEAVARIVEALRASGLPD